jgi:hypothetical protein
MKIKPKQSSETKDVTSKSKSSKGLLTLISLAFITIIVILATFLVKPKQEETKTHEVSTTQSTSSSYSQSTSNSTSESTEPSSTKSKDQESLEEKVKVTKEEAPEDITNQVKDAVTIAQNEAISQKMQLKPSTESRLSLTHSSMVDTFAMAITINNYRYDSIEVFTKVDPNNPKDNHTYQFIATFKSAGKADWFLSGLYIDGQIRLTEYTGGEIGATFG